jgi:hypothetical protein
MTAGPPATTAEDITRLLAKGECSPACLLSRPDSTCACRCHGLHHGEALRQLGAGVASGP